MTEDECNMNLTQTQKNVFSEVYTILGFLEEEEYKKIPEDVISVIEENRNQDYEYKMNDDADISKQSMLPETRALLFNIFRDYLSTEEQKQKIINYQEKEREKLELLKKQKYNSNNIFEPQAGGHKSDGFYESNTTKGMDLIEIKNENFIRQIFSKIRKIFRGNN